MTNTDIFKKHSGFLNDTNDLSTLSIVDLLHYLNNFIVGFQTVYMVNLVITFGINVYILLQETPALSHNL